MQYIYFRAAAILLNIFSMKKQDVRFKLSVVTLSTLLSVVPSFAAPPPVQAQPPGHIETLGPQTFLPVELRQLSRAQLWYLRYDALRRQGVKIPPAGIADPQFAKAFLDKYAYQAPGRDDRPEMFTEKTKIAYADYYGGEGNHGVRGSGRATIDGNHQHKGNLTPMVPVENRDPNMNGAQQVIDGMEEAMWSEILNNEFKYGANETTDVIFTGNYARHSSGQIFPRGLQGRNFAIRIAHFMLRPGPIDPQDKARVQSILPKLTSVLPYPNNVRPKDEGQALRAGLLEFTFREAYTQAEYYAKRLYFGSDSPSNVTIKGERKDLTAHSALLGYSRIYRPISDGTIPFGTIDEALLTFKELQDSLSKTLPADLLPYLPTEQEFVDHFKKTYERQLRIEMARLTGLPNEMMQTLEKSRVLLDLGDLLLQVSRAGNDHNIKLDMEKITYSDRYQLNKMLTDLGQMSVQSSQQVEERLRAWIPDDSKLRQSLAEKYFAFRKKGEELAKAQNMTPEALNTYIKEASRVRNQDRPELVLSHKRVAKFWQVADQAIATGNGKVVESFLEGLVDNNTFNFKDVAPYQIVIRQKRKPSEGLAVREVYDAVEGRYRTILRVHVANGEGVLNGRSYKREFLEKMALQTGEFIASAKPAGEYLEFSFPSVKDLNLARVSLVEKPKIEKSVLQRSNGAIIRECHAIYRGKAS